MAVRGSSGSVPEGLRNIGKEISKCEPWDSRSGFGLGQWLRTPALECSSRLQLRHWLGTPAEDSSSGLWLRTPSGWCSLRLFWFFSLVACSFYVLARCSSSFVCFSFVLVWQFSVLASCPSVLAWCSSLWSAASPWWPGCVYAALGLHCLS